MAHGYDTMMTPLIEGLLEKAGSKFTLVTLSAFRSREITNYRNQLGQGAGAGVPPQVTSTAYKSLSIAFEELAAGKIEAARTGSEAAAETDSDPETADSAEVLPLDAMATGGDADT